MRTIEETIQEIEYAKQEIGHIIDDRSRKGIPFLPYVEEYKFLSLLEESCNAELMESKRINPLNALCQEIHENAKEHGWWETPRELPEIIALCHAELSEALEEYRDNKPLYYEKDGKPEGIAVEMIDCMIRILDWCAFEELDTDKILRKKHEFNKTRPYKHGGKKV